MAEFDIFGSATAIYSKLFTGLFLFVIFIVVLLIFLVIIYLLYNKIFKFKIPVIIFSRRKGRDEIKIDRGGFFKNPWNKVWVFKLKKHKVTIQPIDFKNIIQQKIIFLRQYSMDSFVPMDFDPQLKDQIEIPKAQDGNYYLPLDYNIDEKLDLKTTESDLGFWSSMMMQNVRNRFTIKNKLEQYLPHITFIVSMVVVVVLIIMLMKRVDRLLPIFADAANQLAAATKSCSTGSLTPA